MSLATMHPNPSIGVEDVESHDDHACFVRVDVFDGPLDLLLSLVKEQQLDIATVPLASVAAQYLAYVSMMEALDVEVAAEYLLIAATLVFLKSKALLPPLPAEFLDEETETPEAVEERLRRRLIAYSRYREFGDDLRRRQGEASAFYYREGGDPSNDLVQRYRIDAERLARAFMVMLGQVRPQKRSIAREHLSLIAQMDYIVRRIREQGDILFSTLCHELGMHREAIIVTFLAILELVARGRIDYEQPALLDDIRLFHPTPTDAS
ncbi:MAG: segregation and condensation protein A [Vulcanimicrobiaceae bacterium]